MKFFILFHWDHLQREREGESHIEFKSLRTKNELPLVWLLLSQSLCALSAIFCLKCSSSSLFSEEQGSHEGNDVQI